MESVPAFFSHDCAFIEETETINEKRIQNKDFFMFKNAIHY